MAQGNVAYVVMKLSLPTVVAMVATAVPPLADALCAATLGVSQAAAVALVFPYLSFLQAVGYTVALGCSTWVSRLLGQQESDKAGGVAACGFWLSLGVTALLVVLTRLFGGQVARLLGATSSFMPYVLPYLSVSVLSLPLTAGYYTLSGLLRAYGKPMLAMSGAVVGGAIHLILLPLLDSFGVVGIGLAALAGQGVQFALLWIGWLVGKMPCSLRFKVRGYPKRAVRTILKNGISSLARQGAGAWTAVTVNRVAAGYGAATVAGLSAACKLTGLLYSALLGVGQGFLPLAGYCYGANDRRRLKKAFGFALGLATLTMIVCSVLCFWMAPAWISWLCHGNARLTKTGVAFLRYQLITMPLIPFYVLLNMAVQAADHPVWAAGIACLRQGFCLWLFAAWMPICFGQWGLQLMYPAADLLTFLLCLVFWVIKNGRPLCRLHSSRPF